MARQKNKWKFIFLGLLVLNVFTKSLPLDRRLPSLITVDTNFPDIEIPVINESVPKELTDTLNVENVVFEQPTMATKEINRVGVRNKTVALTTEVIHSEATTNYTRSSMLRQVRPGQEARQYAIELTFDGNNFNGRAVISVQLTASTNEDPIIFHVEDLNIQSVSAGVFTDANATPADFNVEDGLLEISPTLIASSYILNIEYSGTITNGPGGIFQGNFADTSYLGMNLHPTHARRVFPCMDEPNEATTISFTFNNLLYNSIVVNSLLEDGSTTQFRALQGPPHLWGMIAHSFNIYTNIPTTRTSVLLYGRAGMPNQDPQASVAISHFFNALEDWTNKYYSEIIVNQDGRMNIFALPDTDVDWYALSSVCIWEPYIFMPTDHSVLQRKTAFVKIAEAMARQWFGFVVYPENWKYQWVISGLTSYASQDILRSFQDNSLGVDITLLDMNTIFVSDVIQESLLKDGYSNAQPLEIANDLFEESEIRDHVNGLLTEKAPAILRMLRLILGQQNDDYIKTAASALLQNRALQTINSLNFYDAINGYWMHSNYQLIDDLMEFLEPWVTSRGYPLVHVGLRQGGVLVTQEHFGFSASPQVNFQVPLTFTTSINPNFSEENVYDIIMMDGTTTINMNLDEEDFVLFNIQGQGYYRVNYDSELWFRIIEALNDPDRRDQIHPLNRATLVDDALNLARAGKLDYDIAFQVVLSMEHEIEYAVWKAFVRNMDFLRKKLVAYVSDDEDLDQDIYLRMVRRTVGRVESEIGFYPDPLINEAAMTSLTRGLVMKHACQANYQPCIAAAVDWFYDPSASEPVVNPIIPADIRPAVYCTMVREGDQQVIDALYARLEIEPSHYERVVILESLACSQNEAFIASLLLETIANNSPYGVEERGRIFKSVAASSYQNARIAINFMAMRTLEMRNMYGGAEKLEDIIKLVADNMANSDLAYDFTVWVNSVNSNLDDSMDVAERARDRVNEDLQWDNTHMNYVYEWIDENDAPKLVISFALLFITLFLTLINY